MKYDEVGPWPGGKPFLSEVEGPSTGESLSLTERQAGHIEGYAKALQDIQLAITGENTCAKSYDPATVKLDEGRISSYAFDLISGHRGHPLKDFDSVEQISQLMLNEVTKRMRDDLTDFGATLPQISSRITTGSMGWD